MSDIADILLGTGGDAMEATDTMRHIATRLTDEGLVVEIFDVKAPPCSSPTPTFPANPSRDQRFDRTGLLTYGKRCGRRRAPRARALVVAKNPVWDLSSSRAQTFSRDAFADGLAESRVQPHHRPCGSSARCVKHHGCAE